MILLAAPAPAPPLPTFVGDPDAGLRLTEPLGAALAGTESFGPWPDRPWRVRLHTDDASFDQATGGFPGRAALWLGDELHLRPWEALGRRDLGRLLRHEAVHRRLMGAGLRRWEEEARCLWAERHMRPPDRWPAAPDEATQHRLDQALRAGTPSYQAWAYRALRAWLEGQPLPAPPSGGAPSPAWTKEALVLGGSVTVVWPAERVPDPLVVNGQQLSRTLGSAWRFEGPVTFGPGSPVHRLVGPVSVQARPAGWEVRWTTSRSGWIAAATAGELGEDAPREAKRALAAVLARWLEGNGGTRHPDGTLCPLTHCAVVRGAASPATQSAAAEAPRLSLDPRWAHFCGSKGGVALSEREVWGEGPSSAPPAAGVPGDRWATWERHLSASQVQVLKATVRAGIRPGQRGIHLGPSGPYPLEDLRLAAGRAFGWTAWPSNACEVEPDGAGGLHVRGRGWGHNVGLCLSSARHQAGEGWTAEAILRAAFGPGVLP